jgi:uncharacterized protein (DUF2062 family)
MEWLRKKVLNPIFDQLKQGTSPDKLAWSVCLGASLAMFPILGSTTFLCAIVGQIFRLNHVAMQTVNYLFYAPQLALIPVFIRLGEKMTGAEPLPIDLVAMKNLFIESPARFLQDFGMAGAHGILAWAVILPIPTWAAARLLARQFRARQLKHPQSDSSKA